MKKIFKYAFMGFIEDPIEYFGLKVNKILKLESHNNEFIELKYIHNSRVDGLPMFELQYISSNDISLIGACYFNGVNVVDKIELVYNAACHKILEDHSDTFINIKNNKEKLSDIVQKYLNISDEELGLNDITEIERNLKLILLGIR